MKGAHGSLLLGACLASALLAGSTGPAFARNRPPQAIHVEQGSLAAALREIARSTGAEIVTIEPGIAQQGVPAQTLKGNARAALKALLRSTDLRAVWLGGNSFRIERKARRGRDARPVKAPPHPDDGQTGEAIVVAGKFPTPLHDYPGSVGIVPFGKQQAARIDRSDLDDVARRTPIIVSTAFGDGRDKVFVRGIADSSFNGASQPTTSIYLGDALIGFGSPNANLKLYDIASIEVLEGPQGTLFGSGSIGGVIRITPNPVDLDRTEGNALAGIEATDGGEIGWKAAGTVNLPIVAGKLGMRLVAYDERSGGYLDDPQLGSNLNRVDVAGGRLAIGAELGNGFSLDLGGVFQSTKAQDAQYADTSGPLARSAAIREPYSSQLALARVSLRKAWDSGLVLTSVASAGHRSAFDRFDASAGRPGNTAFDTERSSTMFSSETRLSGTMASGFTWVTGLSLEYSEDGQSRALGVPDDTNPLDEVTNITKSGSVFAQGRFKLSEDFQGTLGFRYTMARTDSQPARGGTTSFIKGSIDRHFDPTLALLWRAAPRLSVYGRFQTGYRNGGVTVARGVGRVADFKPDSILMGELGFRVLPSGPHGLTLSGAVSAARWRNVLAELVTPRGTAVTSNIGDARLLTVEANADWDNAEGWSLGASFLYTQNQLLGDLAMQSNPRNRLLPVVPRFSATARAGYTWTGAKRTIYTLGANGQYVGRSVLGPGAYLDLDQGNYLLVDLAASARRGRVTFSVSVDNLLNTHANRFSLGNPLLLFRRDGRVPVRPRTAGVAIGVDWSASALVAKAPPELAQVPRQGMVDEAVAEPVVQHIHRPAQGGGDRQHDDVARQRKVGRQSPDQIGKAQGQDDEAQPQSHRAKAAHGPVGQAHHEAQPGEQQRQQRNGEPVHCLCPGNGAGIARLPGITGHSYQIGQFGKFLEGFKIADCLCLLVIGDDQVESIEAHNASAAVRAILRRIVDHQPVAKLDPHGITAGEGDQRMA